MSRVSPTTVFLVATAAVLAALFVPGPVGGVLLLVVAAGAAALLVATWHRVAPVGRAARIAVLAVLVALAVQRFG